MDNGINTSKPIIIILKNFLFLFIVLRPPSFFTIITSIEMDYSNI